VVPFAVAQQPQSKTPAVSGMHHPLIDTSVNLGRWPFRLGSSESTDSLVSRLRESGVTQAWAASYEGVFQKNLTAANSRVADECRHSEGFLVPFGAVNPLLPDWQEELRRCVDTWQMPGIRLHPNYHGYTLDAPEFAQLVALASESSLIVQLVAWMEDTRHHHRLMPVPDVNLDPLPGVLEEFPDLQFLVTNGYRSPGSRSLAQLARLPHVYFDFAKLDVYDGLAGLIENATAGRVVFGSHSPMFYFDSTRLKMQESVLSDEQLSAIAHQNAQQIMQRQSGANV